MVQIPPPPSITPHQMNLLRIVTALAWSDGNLAAEEVDVMLDHFSRIFATDSCPAAKSFKPRTARLHDAEH